MRSSEVTLHPAACKPTAAKNHLFFKYWPSLTKYLWLLKGQGPLPIFVVLAAVAHTFIAEVN